MRLWFRFKSILRNFFRKPQIESQLDDEVRAYVQMVTDEKVSAGIPLAEARRTALAEFGGIEQVKQAVRDNRAGTFAELLWQDVRYSLRQLRRNSAFTLTIMVTLGFGIGATTAIFSAVYSLLLRPLPFPDSRQLVTVTSMVQKAKSDVLISPDFVAARNAAKSFQQFAGYDSGDDNLTGAGDPLKVVRATVSANFFSVLDVAPQLGRTFSRGEDRRGGPAVIMLSDRLWRNKFGADPHIVGKAAILNGKAQTIIGVLPAHFFFPDLSLEPDYYAPAPFDSDTTVRIDTPVFFMHVIARLRSGVSIEQAQAETQSFFQIRTESYPASLASIMAGQQTIVEPLQRHLTGEDRKPLYILLACVVAVLLISCANVANLQMARAVARQQETALRGALGASRLRLIRQFLVESFILSSLGAALGLVIAVVVTSLVRHAAPLDASVAPSWLVQVFRLPFGKLSAMIQVDAWIVAFTVGLAVATTLLFGLTTAISGSRTDLRNALQSAGMRVSSGRDQRLMRHSLLVIEVGLAFVLLACAGLLIRSFVNVLRYDSGFEPRNTLTGVTLISGQQYDASGEQIKGFVNRLLPRLESLPGVDAAAVASALPLEQTFDNTGITFEDVPTPPIGSWPTLSMISITPDYFRAVGTPILKGRAFNLDDRDETPRVTIVNRTFAKRFFAGDALGKRFNTNIGGKGQYGFHSVTIVGIAEDVRHGGLEQDVRPEAFLPMDQFPQGKLSIALRTLNDPASLTNALRQAVTAVDRNQPVFDIQTMDERVSAATAQRRFIMMLIACFAMLAVVLSAVGVYGVFAYSVARRTQEMGIRLALGASRSGVLGLVVIQAAKMIGLGSILGLSAALALSKLLASLLVGVTPHDPASFACAFILMTLVALLASAIPAQRAAQTDLISALHSE